MEEGHHAVQSSQPHNEQVEDELRTPAPLCCCLSPHRCPHGLFFRETEIPNDRDYSFQWYDAVFELVGALLYLLDICTDLWLAIQYFVEGQTLYGGLTLCWFLWSYSGNLYFWFIINVYLQPENMHANSALERSLELETTAIWSVVFNLKQCVGAIKAVYYGLKSRSSPSNERQIYHDKAKLLRGINANASIIEATLEAAPQFVLQLYILLDAKPSFNKLAGAWRLVSVALSWISLAKGMTIFMAAVRNRESGQAKLGKRYMLLYFLLRLADTGSRLLCFALFIHAFGAWVTAVITFHIALTCWILALQNRCNLFNSQLSVTKMFSLIWVNIVCPVNEDDMAENRHQCRQFLALGLAFHAESLFMVMMWFFHLPEGMEWFQLAGLLLVLTGTAISLLLQVFYNTCCHPPLNVTSEVTLHHGMSRIAPQSIPSNH